MRAGLQTCSILGLVLVFAAVSRGAEKAVPIVKGAAAISAENSSIQFVCAHVGAKPDPRKGGFAKFAGKIVIDSAGKKVESISAEIETASLFTEFPKLTDHLKTADFFEVREYPSARFESTKIAVEKGDRHVITGRLTLHGVTKEISFPAEVKIGEGGLTLKSEFTIDRSQFGMTFAPDKVENKVSLTIHVGEKTQTK